MFDYFFLLSVWFWSEVLFFCPYHCELSVRSLLVKPCICLILQTQIPWLPTYVYGDGVLRLWDARNVGQRPREKVSSISSSRVSLPGCASQSTLFSLSTIFSLSRRAVVSPGLSLDPRLQGLICYRNWPEIRFVSGRSCKPLSDKCLADHSDKLFVMLVAKNMFWLGF